MITAWIGSVLFALLMILYILLAFGAPLGEFAMGGRYKVLPRNIRIACVISIIVQAIAIIILMELGGIFSFGLPRGISKGFGYVLSAYLLFNIFLNFKSKSRKEKLVMLPVSVILAFCILFTSVVS